MPTHEVIQLLFAFCIGVACGIIICMIFTAVKRKNNEDNEAIKPASDPIAEDWLNAFARSHDFTPRETEVFMMLVTTGYKNQEIADSLFMSRSKLQNHISSIYEKAKVKNRAGLMLAIQERV